MKKLENILKNIGLSDSESTVLSAVLLHSNSTALYLAKQITLPRQTIYSILERLEGMGLVASSDRSGTKRFSSNLPMLEVYLEEKSRTFKNTQKELSDLAPEIELHLQKNQTSLPQIKYFTGELGIKYLFEAVLKDFAEPKSRKEFLGFGVNSYEGTGMFKTLEQFIRKRGKLGVETRLIVANSEDDLGIEAKDSLHRQMKKIDIEEGRAGCYIVDDKIYFFSFQDRAGIRIEHKAIASLLKNIFDHTWKNN